MHEAGELLDELTGRPLPSDLREPVSCNCCKATRWP